MLDWLAKKIEGIAEKNAQSIEDAVHELEKHNPQSVTASSSDEEILNKLKKGKAEVFTKEDAGDWLEFLHHVPVEDQMIKFVETGSPKMVLIETPVFINTNGAIDKAGVVFSDESRKRVGDFLKKLKQEGVIKNNYLHPADFIRLEHATSQTSFFGYENQIFMEQSDWDRIKQHKIESNAGKGQGSDSVAPGRSAMDEKYKIGKNPTYQSR